MCVFFWLSGRVCVLVGVGVHMCVSVCVCVCVCVAQLCPCWIFLFDVIKMITGENTITITFRGIVRVRVSLS